MAMDGVKFVRATRGIDPRTGRMFGAVSSGKGGKGGKGGGTGEGGKGGTGGGKGRGRIRGTGGTGGGKGGRLGGMGSKSSEVGRGGKGHGMGHGNGVRDGQIGGKGNRGKDTIDTIQEHVGAGREGTRRDQTGEEEGGPVRVEGAAVSGEWATGSAVIDGVGLSLGPPLKKTKMMAVPAVHEEGGGY